MSRQGGQHSSTPNLHGRTRGKGPETSQSGTDFNLTLKQKQAVKHNKTMALTEAEELIQNAQS